MTSTVKSSLSSICQRLSSTLHSQSLGPTGTASSTGSATLTTHKPYLYPSHQVRFSPNASRHSYPRRQNGHDCSHLVWTIAVVELVRRPFHRSVPSYPYSH